jgi:hypothetical protein
MPPSLEIWHAAFGRPWVRRAAATLEVCESYVWMVASGTRRPSRRRMVILDRYARQKREAWSSHRAAALAAVERDLREEAAALDALIAWCQDELDKKK